MPIKGSIVGTHHELEQGFDLHRRGVTRVFWSESALEDVKDAIERVLDGSAPAPRTVFRLGPVVRRGGHLRDEDHGQEDDPLATP